MSTPITTLEQESSALFSTPVTEPVEAISKPKVASSRAASSKAATAPLTPKRPTAKVTIKPRAQEGEVPLVNPEIVIMVEDEPKERKDTATMADILEEVLEDIDDGYDYIPNKLNDWDYDDDDDYLLKKPVSLLPEGIEAKDMRRVPGGSKQIWIVAIPTKYNKLHFGRTFYMPKGWNPSHGLIPETEKIKVTYPNGVTIERNQIKRKK